MGRLIDAGLFLNNLSGMLSNMEDYDAVRKVINDMPTAYDVDEVVGRLYSLKEYSNPFDSYYDNSLYRLTEFENDCINKAINDAIEIVKVGGIDGN